jgi:hypothetical protein
MKIMSITAACALVAASIVIATPAYAAAPLQQETFEGTFTSEMCDGAYLVSTEFRERVMILDATPRSDGQFFTLSAAYQFTDTVTNALTGDFITVEGKGHVVQIQPRALGDGIFEFAENDAGHFTFYNSDGEVILRENGSIATQYIFDTQNDSAPGGDVLSGEVIRVSGQHPVFPDYCDYLAEVLPS